MGKVVPGKRVNSMENKMLGWEKSNEFDAGLDLTLFRGRLNFTLDYYNKITEDMLWAVAIPISSGFSSLQSNIGKIRNRGVEFTVNSINISKSNFKWNMNFNIAHNSNKVLDLGEIGGRILSATQYGENNALTAEGHPWECFMVIKV